MATKKKAPPFLKKGAGKSKKCPHCGATMKKSGSRMKCPECGKTMSY